jgi:hypothetical protein
LAASFKPCPGPGQRVVKMYYLREPVWVTEPQKSKKLSETAFSLSQKIFNN